MAQRGDLPPFNLPHLCQGRLLFRVMVFAQALAILLAFAPGVSVDPWFKLGSISIFVHWVALLSCVIVCSIGPVIKRFSASINIFISIAVLCAVTFGASTVVFSWGSNQDLFTNTNWLAFSFSNVLIAFIVGLIGIHFFILHAERSLRLQAQSRAELTALQTRIQPHFLFNSLNAVAELTQVDATAAEKAILDLADLFRAAIDAGESVLLEKDIALSQQYLSLEKLRLGSRMQVDWCLPSSIPKIEIPALTLQPLLENAVRHGIESLTQGGIIRIELLDSARTVVIVISNQFELVSKKNKHNGVAIDNIRQRLQLRFGAQAQLHHASVDNTYRVKLVIPKIPKTD